MNVLVEFLVSLLLILGAMLALIGSIGVARLPDFFSRLHGPAKNVTLGVGGTLAASMLYFSATEPGISLHELLILIFLFLTTPVSAHLMAKAGLHLGMKTANNRSMAGDARKSS